MQAACTIGPRRARRGTASLCGALLATVLAGCGSSADSPAVVSSDPAPPSATAPPPVAAPPPAAAPPAAGGAPGTDAPAPPTATPAPPALAAGYPDAQLTCAIDTPMRWARGWTVGYAGGVLRLAPQGEDVRQIVLDTPRATVTRAGDGLEIAGPDSAGIDTRLSIDAGGLIIGAALLGATPADTIRCGTARDGVAAASAETIALACTSTDTTTPGGPTTVAAPPLEFLADFAAFPWRYIATTDPAIRDDEVGRLVAGSGAVVTRDPSIDGRLRYSVAIGNRGIGEDAAYYELADGKLVSMSQGNRRVVRNCAP
ncbi:MAG: hypothetical protein AB7P21_31210 [Lautropia sp.]